MEMCSVQPYRAILGYPSPQKAACTGAIYLLAGNLQQLQKRADIGRLVSAHTLLLSTKALKVSPHAPARKLWS